MYVFNVEALLSDLDSLEAPVLDGSLIVTGRGRDILGDLLEAFVSQN